MSEHRQNISIHFGENCVEGIKKEETELLGLSAIAHFKIF